ncbi:MAG: hypothetical protein KGQ49_06985, partial [Verrucomicrobia bacterium]|nr:hypothetical protein [Verrucomicrobiota bacterium]
VAMHGCFQKAYEFSSKYEVEGTHISARVIRRGLIENPEYHLDQLGERLAEMRNRQPSFGAKFLENDLTEQVGVDAGGLRRDFVGDLLKGLITHMNSLVFRKIHGSELYMPVASRHCSPGALPGLDWNESALYSKLGHLLMFSYLDHSNLVIGQCFERALFQAALSLTPEEVRTPFSHLGDATILKMARQIFEARGTPVHTLDFLQRSSEQRTNAEWTDMVNWASDAATWPQNLVFNPQNPEHRQHVVNGLKELIFEQVGHYLSPIHAIAQGMDLVKTRWAPTQRIELDQFIEKVQGSLDRATIANAIVASQIPYIDQRIRWLKEWIRDPETRVSDISNLIKFATGSPSLAVNGQIRVNPQAEVPGRPYNPALIGHSCFNTIDISPVPCTYGTYNNHDKANFIRAVKEMALTQAGEYSMA